MLLEVNKFEDSMYFADPKDACTARGSWKSIHLTLEAFGVFILGIEAESNFHRMFGLDTKLLLVSYQIRGVFPQVKTH